MQRIIVICGPPCSGKSAISRFLQESRQLRSFPRFEMDEIRLAMFPNSHTADDRAKAYAKMHEFASETLLKGLPGAVLVATYQPAQQRRSVQVLADRFAAQLLVFECRVSPEKAVERFGTRTESHAAVDLTAERVWDLAQDFRFYEKATILDTTDARVEDIGETVLHAVRAGKPTQEIEQWIGLGNPSPPAKQSEVNPSSPLPKLTPSSRRRARWSNRSRRLLNAISLSSAFVAFVILLKAFLDVFYFWSRRIGLEGDPTSWIQVFGVIAGIAYGVAASWDYFGDSPRAKLNEAVKNAGTIPRMSFRDAPGSNAEVFRRYSRRIRPAQRHRLLVPNVPLFFIVGPRRKGFDVFVNRISDSPINNEELKKRAANWGLDWSSYLAWRKMDKEDQYLEVYNEPGVRVLNIIISDTVTPEVCRGSFTSYVSTDLASNLLVEGRHGFEFRQILEGPNWDRSASPRQLLDLRDLQKARQTYEMLASVQVGLTTSDGYLILQRRSNLVWSAGGGVTSSGAGALHLKKDWTKNHRLDHHNPFVAAALRETEEEIGWKPHRDDDLREPFLGAAFNLLRGRDLNFYCYFHTRWTLGEVSAGVNRWFPLKDVRHRPVGVARAGYSWEVAHIIPVPFDAILPSGRLDSPYEAILGDARHVRGLIHCVARSEKFEKVRTEYLASRRR